MSFGSRHRHSRPHTATAPQPSSIHAQNDQGQTDSQPRRTTTGENRRPTTAVGDLKTRRFEVEERAESPGDADGDFVDGDETMMQEGNKEEGIDEQSRENIPPPDYASGTVANTPSQPTNNPSSTIPASHVYHLRLKSGLGKESGDVSLCTGGVFDGGRYLTCFPPFTIRNHRRIQETERNRNHSKSALTKGETLGVQFSLQIDKTRCHHLLHIDVDAASTYRGGSWGDM